MGVRDQAPLFGVKISAWGRGWWRGGTNPPIQPEETGGRDFRGDLITDAGANQEANRMRTTSDCTSPPCSDGD
ncbi:hypothetical protein DPEC_G00150630 [Dallia pectoralis]|uniref:Uncharacterized protein n=1 Tax=Dallia pectoralis TaxID=75939 RepID=A0ACC2GIU0_DALPE|nr:hypothetical protein DPEC_G00150630 [Dallia pectoralis]